MLSSGSKNLPRAYRSWKFQTFYNCIRFFLRTFLLTFLRNLVFFLNNQAWFSLEQVRANKFIWMPFLYSFLWYYMGLSIACVFYPLLFLIIALQFWDKLMEYNLYLSVFPCRHCSASFSSLMFLFRKINRW
jgi:hypothetical protein